MGRNDGKLDRAQEASGDIPSGSGRPSIDNLDVKILRHLLIRGRSPFRHVAAELNISTTTVTTRVAELERERVLKGYGALVDFEKLGYELTVITEILVSKGKLLEMEREIAKLPGVCAVYDVTGEIDGIVVAKFKNREDLSRFTKGLLSMPFVDRANTHVVLTTVKEDFRIQI
ncbi:MAG TPA: Lrp/AsnC family transcriptional regulator [Nitrososphaerales archaeon]|nr:Lrp/AsnC family transcriptional regulator [Nitrososphaerales archaeon]